MAQWVKPQSLQCWNSMWDTGSSPSCAVASLVPCSWAPEGSGDSSTAWTPNVLWETWMEFLVSAFSQP